MQRITETLLRGSLLVAAVGSLLSLTLMVVEIFTPVRYYWWAAVAMFGAMPVIAAALYVLRQVPTRDPVGKPA